MKTFFMFWVMLFMAYFLVWYVEVRIDMATMPYYVVGWIPMRLIDVTHSSHLFLFLYLIYFWQTLAALIVGTGVISAILTAISGDMDAQKRELQ